MKIEIPSQEQDVWRKLSEVEIKAAAVGAFRGHPIRGDQKADCVRFFCHFLGRAEAELSRRKEDVHPLVREHRLDAASALSHIQPRHQQNGGAPQNRHGENDEKKRRGQQKKSTCLQKSEDVTNDFQYETNHAKLTQSSEEGLVDAVRPRLSDGGSHVGEKAPSAALLYGGGDLLQEQLLGLARLFFGAFAGQLQCFFLLLGGFSQSISKKVKKNVPTLL